uniref:Uncharacterized protein n=1 Tax=Dicentrarchus labrax TaxID=13489 RepID=A0A8C4GVC6_DICLA
MSAASCLLTEDQFLCSICLDVFTDPVSTPCGHNFCKSCITKHWNINVQCQCPNCNKVFNKRPELQVNTFISEMVAQFRQSAQQKGKKAELGNTEAEIQQMIQKRRLKIEEIKRSVELSKEGADREIADGVQVFTALKESVERSQAELIDTIKEKQRKTEKQAEDFIKELEQEISELKKRSSEVDQLSQSEDHLHLLQTVNQLEETLSKQMKKVELKRVQQYAVDVTLDPDTAYPKLTLSEDGKQVTYGDVKKTLPDNPERFNRFTNVLAKQSFSSGRFYYEVQVKGKIEWELGVARESINRKGQITLRPQNGYWTIWLKNKTEYEALAGPPVRLSLKSQPEKVGVFVDYEEGLVSFYDVDAAALIYSFTGCSFTEKLYPYFSPDNNNKGNNSAPLIISPVNHTE